MVIQHNYRIWIWNYSVAAMIFEASWCLPFLATTSAPRADDVRPAFLRDTLYTLEREIDRVRQIRGHAVTSVSGWTSPRRPSRLFLDKTVAAFFIKGLARSQSRTRHCSVDQSGFSVQEFSERGCHRRIGLYRFL